MDQLLFGALLVVLLLGLAGYYAWRQVQTLRRLRHAEGVPEDDAAYQRRMAWRRLACCGLMVLFAGLLVGSHFLQDRARAIGEEGEAARARGEEPVLAPEQRNFLRAYGAYWIFALLVLLAIVTLAVADLLAIRRFGLRQIRRIQADRRAMIEDEVARIRRGRNGQA